MKKFINLTTIVVMSCMLATIACSCSNKGNEDETTSESTVAVAAITTVEETSAEAIEATTTTATEETIATTAEATVTTVEETTATTTEATVATVEETTATTAEDTASETVASNEITDEMALDAIITYCVLDNPEFASIGADHWVIISSDDSQVVVLFTSYTGSENRYYIDRATGNTTVTELVPGIIDEEQSTGESFNARDYLAAEIYG